MEDKPTAAAAPQPKFDLVPVSLLVFIGWSLLAVLWGRCIYADGAYAFLTVMEHQGFVPLIASRIHAAYVLEWPMVAAIKLGVRQPDLLLLAFGLGCFLPWPLAMWLSRKFAPEHFWIVMLACAAGYLNTAFMAVGEHIVAHAFFWPVLFILLFVRPLTPFAAATLLVLSVILLRCYETFFFLGPPLAVLAVYRAFHDEKPWARAVGWLAAGLFLAATLFSLASILHPESPANLVGFKRGIWYEWHYPSWPVVWSVIWTGLMLAAWIFLKLRHRLTAVPTFVSWSDVVAGRFSTPLFLIIACIWGFWPMLTPGELTPASQYGVRFLNLIVPLGLLPVALATACRPGWIEKQRQALTQLSAVFLLSQSLWQIGMTWEWHQYLHTLRSLLADNAGAFRLKDTNLVGTEAGQRAYRFDWIWANPSLSIALAPQGKVRSLMLSPVKPSWEPFNPTNVTDLPKLSDYGFDYTRFAAALRP